MAKKKKAAEGGAPLFYIFYNQERFDNWLNSLESASFEPPESDEELPTGVSVLLNFTEDITIEVLKIIRLYQNGRFSREEATKRLQEVEDLVMVPQEGELGEIVGSMQVNLLVLFAACRAYLEGDFRTDVKTLVKEGRKAGDDDPEESLRIAAGIGAAVIDGASCCGKYLRDNVDDLTLFDEWLNEVDIMANAMKSLAKFDEEPGEAS